ncbi:hypothetical protein AB0K08_15045 [Citricoccus sp. NPDC055426]|jgi:hypothetical protein|uniref:hypothetical protein n=1 Tax=Micrococcales TaxID=85006 RepID=UPI00095A3704|nr:hypothetical protein [Serinicoccus sp. CUA-874]OLT17087.1 hypothetical protein BJF80_02450 [Serinicoccus sp. CUA-874]HOQ53958.1 hypothetical protein [Micropruina sp.]
MSGRNPLHHTSSQQPDETPVVLPHVVIIVTENSTLDVTVDGTPFPPPAAGSEWTRGTFGLLLDAVTKDRTIAVRIEVREVDGTVFTDLIHTRRRPASEADSTAAPTRRGRRARQQQPPVLVEVTGDGFVPGEDIAVAVIVAHTDATGTGAARALLDQRQLDALAESPHEVVLYGRISGTTVVRRVP